MVGGLGEVSGGYNLQNLAWTLVAKGKGSGIGLFAIVLDGISVGVGGAGVVMFVARLVGVHASVGLFVVVLHGVGVSRWHVHPTC